MWTKITFYDSISLSLFKTFYIELDSISAKTFIFNFDPSLNALPYLSFQNDDLITLTSDQRNSVGHLMPYKEGPRMSGILSYKRYKIKIPKNKRFIPFKSFQEKNQGFQSSEIIILFKNDINLLKR